MSRISPDVRVFLSTGNGSGTSSQQKPRHSTLSSDKNITHHTEGEELEPLIAIVDLAIIDVHVVGPDDAVEPEPVLMQLAFSGIGARGQIAPLDATSEFELGNAQGTISDLVFDSQLMLTDAGGTIAPLASTSQLNLADASGTIAPLVTSSQLQLSGASGTIDTIEEQLPPA